MLFHIFSASALDDGVCPASLHDCLTQKDLPHSKHECHEKGTSLGPWYQSNHTSLIIQSVASPYWQSYLDSSLITIIYGNFNENKHPENL
jgi:hypothetical protein